MNEPSNDARQVQHRIHEFLGDVDKALSGANTPPDERSAILEDLRTQIADMLASRAGDTPTLADVDAVLAAIDPPQAYAGPAGAGGNQPGTARQSNLVMALRQACSAWRYRGKAWHYQEQYEQGQFSQDAWACLQYADQEARHYNHEYLGTEHVLLGLLREEQGAAGKALRQLGADLERVRREMDTLLRPGPDPVAPGRLPCTPRMKQALDAAIGAARLSHSGPARTEHLLYGLLLDPDSLATHVLTRRFGLAPDAIVRQIGLSM